MRTDWKIKGEWGYIPVFAIDIWNGYYCNKFLLDNGLDFLRILMFYKDNKLEVMYRSTSSENEHVELAKKKFLEDPKAWHKMMDAYYERQPKILQRMEEVHETDYSGMSNEDLLKIFLETREYIGFFGAHDWWPFSFDEQIIESVNLDGYLEKHPEERNKILELTAPDAELETMREEFHILELAQKAKGMTKEQIMDAFSEELSMLVHEFGWISALMIYPPPTEETYADHILNALKGDVDAELEEKKQYLDRINERLKQHIAAYNPPPEVIESIHAIRKLSEMRAVGEMDCIKCINRCRNLDTAIQKAIDVEYKDYWMMYSREVVDMLQGAPKPHDMDQRKVLECCYRDEQGRFVRLTNAHEMWAKVQDDKIPDGPLHGMPGHPGKVTGKVTMIRSSKDMEHFTEGDILVAKSTCVDYIVIMKRAGAIVTEYGGITSHAAVVTREIGVPSVIGVPKLTRIIRDGDRVEVDAVNGVVTKL